MLVKEIMTREVAYVTDQTTLQEAADTMKRVDAGELPVVIGNEAVGIVTDRDMVIRGIAQGLDHAAFDLSFHLLGVESFSDIMG